MVHVVNSMSSSCNACGVTDNGDVYSGDDDNHVQVLNPQTHNDDDEGNGGHDTVRIVQV